MSRAAPSGAGEKHPREEVVSAAAQHGPQKKSRPSAEDNLEVPDILLGDPLRAAELWVEEQHAKKEQEASVGTSGTKAKADAGNIATSGEARGNVWLNDQTPDVSTHDVSPTYLEPLDARSGSSAVCHRGLSMRRLHWRQEKLVSWLRIASKKGKLEGAARYLLENARKGIVSKGFRLEESAIIAAKEIVAEGEDVRKLDTGEPPSSSGDSTGSTQSEATKAVGKVRKSLDTVACRQAEVEDCENEIIAVDLGPGAIEGKLESDASAAGEPDRRSERLRERERKKLEMVSSAEHPEIENVDNLFGANLEECAQEKVTAYRCSACGKSFERGCGLASHKRTCISGSPGARKRSRPSREQQVSDQAASSTKQVAGSKGTGKGEQESEAGVQDADEQRSDDSGNKQTRKRTKTEEDTNWQGAQEHGLVLRKFDSFGLNSKRLRRLEPRDA